MARLLEVSTGQFHPVRTHHTLGRSADSVDTSLPGRMTSRIHASLEWNGKNWLLRDLSRNGTWLSGHKVQSHDSVPLKAGDTLCFGAPDTPEWRLVDDSAPVSTLVAITSEASDIELKPFLFLPTEEAPEMVLTFSQRDLCWSRHALDSAAEQAPAQSLNHNDTIRCGDFLWRLFLADSGSKTDLYQHIETHVDDFEFVFDLSLDEENTSLELKKQEQTINLGERSHHYLLLHLARQRAQESADGLDQKSQGWIDNERLTRELGFDMSHINILIFRARKQLAKDIESSVDTEHLVERGKGRMRFGCPKFKIYKGEKLTYQLPSVGSA